MKNGRGERISSAVLRSVHPSAALRSALRPPSDGRLRRHRHERLRRFVQRVEMCASLHRGPSDMSTQRNTRSPSRRTHTTSAEVPGLIACVASGVKECGHPESANADTSDNENSAILLAMSLSARGPPRPAARPLRAPEVPPHWRPQFAETTCGSHPTRRTSRPTTAVVTHAPRSMTRSRRTFDPRPDIKPRRRGRRRPRARLLLSRALARSFASTRRGRRRTGRPRGRDGRRDRPVRAAGPRRSR